MTEQKQIYKCNICGNIVEILHTGVGQLVCCGQPMNVQVEKKQENLQEKHLPIIEKTETGISVKVGEISHPMEDEHYIEWIEIISKNGKYGRKFLNPGDLPEAEFATLAKNINARAYCNVHGLWKT